MATYGYRCQRDGAFEIRRPIGTAPGSSPCPRCGAESTRVFTAPLLGLAHHGLMAAIDRAEASRSEPEVVSALPARARGPRRAQNPRTRGLPRP